MIGKLFAVVGVEGAGRLRANLLGLVAESVLMGVGFVLMVPLLGALLTNDVPGSVTWLAATAGLMILYSFVRYRTQIAGYLAAVGLANGLYRTLGDHIAKLPIGWFEAERVGRVGRLTSQGVIDVMGVPAHLLRPVVSAIVTPVTVVALMFVFDWRLALATVLTAPIIAFVFRWTGDLVQSTDHRVDAAASEAAGRVVEFAQAQAVLRAFGRASEGHTQLSDALQEQRDAGRHQIFRVSSGLTSFVLVLQLAFTVILIFGTNLALGGEIDIPELLALLVLTVRYVEPLIGAADLGGALRISQNSLARMDALLATAPLAEPATSKRVVSSDIEFENVGFSYGDTPVLEEVSFTVPERTMTAIVGPSGSGKTTVLRLISRFWDVGAGAVRVGGVNVREQSTLDLMAQISTVFQDVYLFDATIEENIRIGRPDATADEVEQAAQLARVDEIADRLPGGLRARVGEGGAALSGGERQRVSIARAILKDTPIVLLDEATAALDPVNEAAVQDGLRELTKEKTLVVVAHRLQTVQSADQILFLDGGKIVERGSHEELLADNGRYADFWKERSRASGWRLAGSGND